MRILHVLPNGEEGGTQRLTASLMSGSRGAGHEAAVASAPGCGVALFDQHNFFEIPAIDRSSAVKMLRACRALRGIIDGWCPDVVHAHTVRAAVAASLTTRRGRHPAAIVTVHGAPDETLTTVTRALRCAGLTVASDGPGLSTRLAERGLKCRTIANGVSPAPPAADPDDLRHEWSIPRATRLLIAVGRLVPQKNFLLAVQALPAIPDAVLVIVGDGPLHDQLYADARRLHVADRLRLVGFRADARAVMGAADAIVMPSLWEGMPLAGIEALSGGTPLVATAVLGLAEWLTDGVDALLVPPCNPEELAGALRLVLNDGDLAAGLAREGRKTASRYTEVAMVENYLRLYAELA